MSSETKKEERNRTKISTINTFEQRRNHAQNTKKEEYEEEDVALLLVANTE